MSLTRASMKSLNIQDIAKTMGGTVIGPTSVNVPGPRHSMADRSLTITIEPRAPGGFIVHSHCGDDFAACRDFVRAALGLGTFKKGQSERRGPLVLIQSRPDDQKQRSDWARRIWQQSVQPAGTIVEQYLRSQRRLELSVDFAHTVVRFHGSLKYGEGRSPAMVCLMRNILSNEPVAIQRTFLDRKTALKIERKMLGSAKGAAIKIDDNFCNGRLTIGEGFETALAARHAALGPVWALGSAGAVGAFPVLQGLAELTLLKEIDPTSEMNTHECGQRYLRAQRRVKIITPNIGKDFNDVWQMSQEQA